MPHTMKKTKKFWCHSTDSDVPVEAILLTYTRENGVTAVYPGDEILYFDDHHYRTALYDFATPKQVPFTKTRIMRMIGNLIRESSHPQKVEMIFSVDLGRPGVTDPTEIRLNDTYYLSDLYVGEYEISRDGGFTWQLLGDLE